MFLKNKIKKYKIQLDDLINWNISLQNELNDNQKKINSEEYDSNTKIFNELKNIKLINKIEKNKIIEKWYNQEIELLTNKLNS